MTGITWDEIKVIVTKSLNKARSFLENNQKKIWYIFFFVLYLIGIFIFVGVIDSGIELLKSMDSFTEWGLAALWTVLLIIISWIRCVKCDDIKQNLIIPIITIICFCLNRGWDLFRWAWSGISCTFSCIYFIIKYVLSKIDWDNIKTWIKWKEVNYTYIILFILYISGVIIIIGVKYLGNNLQWLESMDIWQRLELAALSGTFIFGVFAGILEMQESEKNQTDMPLTNSNFFKYFKPLILIVLLILALSIGGIVAVLITQGNEHSFIWDEIPGNDSGKVIDFIEQKYHITWAKTANIEKIDNGKTIIIYTEKNFLLLKLNNEKTKLKLSIDNVDNGEFDANTEKNKLNIYWNVISNDIHFWVLISLFFFLGLYHIMKICIGKSKRSEAGYLLISVDVPAFVTFLMFYLFLCYSKNLQGSDSDKTPFMAGLWAFELIALNCAFVLIKSNIVSAFIKESNP